jgi:ABC-type lipoprotein release transport system permease subunit
MIASARSTRGITINGIDLATETSVTPLDTKVVEGDWLDDNDRNPIMVSAKTAERLNLRVGSKVVITFSDQVGDVTGAAFRVRGIYKTASTRQDDANAYVRKSDLQKISKVNGIHEIAVILSDQNSSNQLMLDLHEALASKQGSADAENTDWLVRDWLTLNPFLKTSMQSMAIFNIVFVLIFVIAMSFGIVNILLMSVFERTREFGVLMAVGMVKGKIRKLIVLEAAFLGLVGALLGVVASIVVVAILNTTGLDLTSISAGIGDFGIDTVLYPSVKTSEYFFTFIAVVLAALLSGLYPARQILKQRPVDAMSEKH